MLEDISLKLVNLLIDKKYHISFAESATGGLLASSIVSISNASSVLEESYVTYSNLSKEKILGVKEETINKFDVVSKEVVKEMAIGLHNITNSDVCISISGVAGPSGGSILNPVGTICIGYYINGHTFEEKVLFEGSRNEVREKTVYYVFNKLIDMIGD